nr:tyrosine-type recombinase/integrase [Bifidobacterium catenulatum]
MSRAELSDSEGAAFDIHYGDVLIKYGSVLDLKKAKVPRIADDAVADRQTCDCLQDGDVIIADTAEDSAVGKCTELCNSAGKKVFSGLHTMPLRPIREYASGYLGYYLNSPAFHDQLLPLMQGIKVISVSRSAMEDMMMAVPSIAEQASIGAFFDRLDSLITLHQRKYDGCTLSPIFFRKVHTMQENITAESLFCDYYAQWVKTYKEGAIRDVTMSKYRLTQSWLGKLIPELRLADMDRTAYQQLINGYAQHHERQTTMDFHHQIKGAILDAVDEGLIPRDPTRKVIIKGKQPRIKKMKYLNQFELHAMLADLDLGSEASWDWLILLIAKTGLRFSEALGLTPDDFDFTHQTLSVSKTWDYKNGGGFVPTKNESSVRKVQLDWQLIMQLSGLLKNLPHDKPIFVHGKIYNSTANGVLARHCKNVDAPVISIHGLRHTHASLLLFAGVSIASVSRRLGHASMTTTQETYLHVIRELENKDVDIVMRALSTLI